MTKAILLDDIVAGFSDERQQHIQDRADVLKAEYLNFILSDTTRKSDAESAKGAEKK